MSELKIFWALLLSTCLLFQIVIVPVASTPTPKKETEIEERQAPLSPSQFSLAATRFIVLLPFLPLLMLVPGVTGVLMPMFMALQDRLTTIAPNLGIPNIFGSRPTNSAGTGSVSNPGVALTTSTEAPETTPAPTRFFRSKRATLFKSASKAINEGFKEALDFLYKTDDVLNLLTSSQADCRRQAVCRLHHAVDPSIGSFLGNVIEVLKIESKVEKLDVSDFTRSILKEVLQAASTGLLQQDCSSVYSRCSVVSPSRKP